MEYSKRIVFLDVLRAFLIFLVIVLHAALSYLKPLFPLWVYNPEQNDLFIGLLCTIIDGPIMMAPMFFIAGYFTVQSLTSKGTKTFIKDKLLHIGIPWVLGVLILAPLACYISQHSIGKRISYFDFFANSQLFSQYHFWFLGILLVFFMLTALVYIAFRDRIQSISVQGVKQSKLIFLLVIFLAAAISSIVNLFCDLYSWTNIYVIQFQNIKLPVYLVYFIFGIYANYKSWFRNGYKPKIFSWSVLYLISLIVYLFFDVMFKFYPVLVYQKIIINFTQNINILCFLFMLASIFQKYFDRDTKVLRFFSKSSFGAYMVHINVLFVILYATQNIHASIFLKLLLQIVISTAFTWGISFALKNVPGLKRIL